MEVVLLEGSVSVEPSNSWFDFSMLRRAPVMLRPGQRLSAVAGEPLEITLVDADALTSWRDEADARR
jgi:ferric-dicitrate binding protein FerR (iron transport regulator)